MGLTQGPDKIKMKKLLQPTLPLCILLDVMGMVSFSIPVLGEFSDVIWAPVSAFLFYKMFGGKIGIFGAGFNFIEELFPFSDFIPSFTLAYTLRYFFKKETATKNIPQQLTN